MGASPLVFALNATWLGAGGLRRGGLAGAGGVGPPPRARRPARPSKTGGAAPAGEREDLLSELVGAGGRAGPVLAQVLEQVLDPAQPGIAFREIGLGEELRQLDDEADEVLGAVEAVPRRDARAEVGLLALLAVEEQAGSARRSS